MVGERALRHLRDIDKVAYVRFASVYRQFDDVDEFQQELARLERAGADPLPGEEPLPGIEAEIEALATEHLHRSAAGGREPEGTRGMTDTEKAVIELSANALKVLQRRYLKKGESGEQLETPEEMFRRVARAIAQAERLYNPAAPVEEWEAPSTTSWPASSSCPTPRR